MAGPTRVAVVAASLDRLGGQGIQAETLIDRLRSEGIEAELLPIDPRFPRGLRWVRRLPYARTVLNQALYLPSLWSLRRADVVAVFSASYGSFLLAPAPALAAARLLKKRVLLSYHSGEADGHLRRDGAWVRRWLSLADAVLVPSEFLRQVFGRHGIRVQVVPNVVDLSRFRFRSRQPLRPALLCTRNLEAIYGVDVVIEAFHRVRRRHPEATLTLAGTGREERRLRALVTGTAGAVRFEGRVPPEKMPAIYDRSDLFLNASVVDNQPVSILEAFAAGLPVISTPPGDVPAMLRHGGTGWIVPPGDPQAMAEAALALLGDPLRAAALAREARAHVERHSWSRVAPLWRRMLSGDEEMSPCTAR
ncbi:MAG TPA: glycosyltransferase family 4 protein [Candidatus Polarisedimenticolia bacterium]|nr:glycosyltransferase family 4 protein [Candidatus Polarisedimenticolia bacterium]